MIPIACTLIRRLAPVLAPALVLAVLGCREDAESPTAPEPTPALTTAATSPLVFRQVSAGFFHTCAVTTDDRVYCWGSNLYGQLGDRTTTDRLGPVPVAGAVRFRQVTAGRWHTCAITTGDRAYCWGRNAHGQLGLGTFRDRSVPTAVAGGLQFRQVSAGDRHTCGSTLADRAYCWGKGDQGRLGDGTADTEDFERPAPAAVAGGLLFSRVSAGHDHSCGVTTANRAYCWGANFQGQLGSGGVDLPTPTLSTSPVAVASGRRFDRISASWQFSCAVTTDNRAFCWGAGPIGDGKPFLRYSPRTVAGGLLFRGVSTGLSHACAVTTDDRAFCWGTGPGLGNGTDFGYQLSPAPVVGGLDFRQVDAGVRHTCGVTTDDRAYCWGGNDVGQLGDGTTTARSTPTPVAGAS
jgi:alpha-tubulin suppressor-like RCC1 family protein